MKKTFKLLTVAIVVGAAASSQAASPNCQCQTSTARATAQGTTTYRSGYAGAASNPAATVQTTPVMTARAVAAPLHQVPSADAKFAFARQRQHLRGW